MKDEEKEEGKRADDDAAATAAEAAIATGDARGAARTEFDATAPNRHSIDCSHISGFAKMKKKNHETSMLPIGSGNVAPGVKKKAHNRYFLSILGMLSSKGSSSTKHDKDSYVVSTRFMFHVGAHMRQVGTH